MLGDSLLRSVIDYKEEHRPDLILNFVRDGVSKTLRQGENDGKDGMEMGGVAYHPDKKILEYAGSRMNLVYFQNGEMHELKADKNFIGGFDAEAFEFSLQTISTQEKTTFYLFSDGFQDQFGGEQNRKIGSKRLKELLAEIHQKSMYEQKVLLEIFLYKWMNQQADNQQMDDILVMGIKVWKNSKQFRWNIGLTVKFCKIKFYFYDRTTIRPH